MFLKKYINEKVEERLAGERDKRWVNERIENLERQMWKLERQIEELKGNSNPANEEYTCEPYVR